MLLVSGINFNKKVNLKCKNNLQKNTMYANSKCQSDSVNFTSNIAKQLEPVEAFIPLDIEKTIKAFGDFDLLSIRKLSDEDEKGLIKFFKKINDIFENLELYHKPENEVSVFLSKGSPAKIQAEINEDEIIKLTKLPNRYKIDILNEKQKEAVSFVLDKHGAAGVWYPGGDIWDGYSNMKCLPYGGSCIFKFFEYMDKFFNKVKI